MNKTFIALRRWLKELFIPPKPPQKFIVTPRARTVSGGTECSFMGVLVDSNGVITPVKCMWSVVHPRDGFVYRDPTPAFGHTVIKNAPGVYYITATYRNLSNAAMLHVVNT